MTDADPLRSDLAASSEFEPAQYALSAVVYAERGDEILLLQRAEGSAMAGQWFLPGDLEIVGCSPMFVYGYDMLQISYRGRVAAGDVTISHEHDGERWVKAADMRALLTDEVIEEMAGDSEDVARLLGHIRTDLDRYLARMESAWARR